MKTKHLFGLTALACSFVLVTLFVCKQYSKTNSSLLLKENVEAISESTYGDPGANITLYYCFRSLKKKKDAVVYRCQDGTTMWDRDVQAVLNPSVVIFHCTLNEGYSPKAFASYGYCYNFD